MVAAIWDWLFGTQPSDDLSDEQHRRINRDNELRLVAARLQVATGVEPTTREIWAATPPVLRADTSGSTLTTTE